jgi:Hint domain
MKAGDLVLTPMGETKTVRWIDRRVVSMRFAGPVRNLPVWIKAGALGNGLPTRDLLLSGAHDVPRRHSGAGRCHGERN